MNCVTSIRLYSDQVERLKNTNRYVSVLDSAIRRYESGELILKHRDIESELIPLSIRRQFKYSADKIREILDAHFNTPISLEDQISQADKEIESLMKYYCSRPYYIKGE